jgi:glycosyltransferase involved in cell wall biosynthesis
MVDRTPAISVLLPVYNAQLYLGAAIESILIQTFDDFELLALNDGSTDLSLVHPA